MKALLTAFLILITFLSCYFENIYLSFLPPQPEQVIPFTIRSVRYFDFDQEKALGNKRKIALSRYVPIYTYVPQMAEVAKKEVVALIAMVSRLQERKSVRGEELVMYLREEFGLELSQEVATKLLRHSKLQALLNGILTVEESILQNKIVDDPEPLVGKKSIEVLYRKPAVTETYSVEEVITLEEARIELQEKVNQLFWQVDGDILNQLTQIVLGTLQPNLNYDQRENHNRIEEIIRQYPSKVITYKPGEILVPFQKTLSEKDALLLAAYQKEGKNDLYWKAPWVLIAILFITGLYSLFLSKILWVGWRKKPPYRLLFSSLIVAILLWKASLLFSTFPIFIVPFAVLPLIIVLLHSERVAATCTTLTGAMLLSLFCGYTLETLFFFTFGGVAAVLVTFNVQKRIYVLIPSLVVGIVNVATLAAMSLDWSTIVSHLLNWQEFDPLYSMITLPDALYRPLGWAFVGGFAAGPLALLLLPLLEASWHTASTFKLTKYADLQHPLMRDLLSKAAATYQHTMTVAYLAQTAGEAIGANTLLLRVGAYYHDIGKMTNPKLFAENQSGGQNPHNDLDAYESAKIIINHAKHGEEIARKMGLPEIILEFISQHHGTMLVEYFYNKAVKESSDSRPLKRDFRYPGPKPQTVEAAILMIVDAVEAASRSLKEPTREKIEEMIRLIIVKRIADGQFDECNLSTRYLARIVEKLVNSLEASLHSRVEYPWQEKKKKAELMRIEKRGRMRQLSSV
jgi:putative nucleotidyltransferase with HDIG domain